MPHKFILHRSLLWRHTNGVRKSSKKRTILCGHSIEKLTLYSRQKLEQRGKNAVADGEDKGKEFTELTTNRIKDCVNPADMFPGIPLVPCSNKPTRVTKRRKRRTISYTNSTESTQKLTTGEKLEPKGTIVTEDGEREKEVAVHRNIETQDYFEPVVLLPGRSLVPCRNDPKPGVIFVLEKASLVPAYVGRKYEILNPNKHADFLRKKKLNPYNYRPDIIHEVLGVILGSQLNMAGAIQAIYVQTDLGQLIKIKPHVNIPPTLGKFCAMMSQLLQKFSIKATGKGEKLLQLIENPLVQHLPVNSKKLGLSFSSPKAVKLRDYIRSIDSDITPVFVIGAMAHGKIDSNYIEDLISVSALPLSAAVCVERICFELERRWRIT